eukprot:c11291_g1_i1.p1 GENE.c11291_g1_i1~~c11291_g1_i1.p1  ORF type:complete len:584 (+),score=83.80 c11291_g1_i1:33-1784(+)
MSAAQRRALRVAGSFLTKPSLAGSTRPRNVQNQPTRALPQAHPGAVMRELHLLAQSNHPSSLLKKFQQLKPEDLPVHSFPSALWLALRASHEMGQTTDSTNSLLRENLGHLIKCLAVPAQSRYNERPFHAIIDAYSSQSAPKSILELIIELHTFGIRVSPRTLAKAAQELMKFPATLESALEIVLNLQPAEQIFPQKRLIQLRHDLLLSALSHKRFDLVDRLVATSENYVVPQTVFALSTKCSRNNEIVSLRKWAQFRLHPDSPVEKLCPVLCHAYITALLRLPGNHFLSFLEDARRVLLSGHHQSVRLFPSTVAALVSALVRAGRVLQAVEICKLIVASTAKTSQCALPARTASIVMSALASTTYLDATVELRRFRRLVANKLSASNKLRKHYVIALAKANSFDFATESELWNVLSNRQLECIWKYCNKHNNKTAAFCMWDHLRRAAPHRLSVPLAVQALSLINNSDDMTFALRLFFDLMILGVVPEEHLVQEKFMNGFKEMIRQIGGEGAYSGIDNMSTFELVEWVGLYFPLAEPSVATTANVRTTEDNLEEERPSVSYSHSSPNTVNFFDHIPFRTPYLC